MKHEQSDIACAMTAERVQAILGGLKDFQRATVDYVFRRLYLDPDPTHRFLVADEVGLGKTLVARGLIARTIEHLQAKGIPRVDVVYICSNSEIARQNIARLNVTGCKNFELATRITLLPTVLHNLQESPVNFVSFTPGTSFNLRSSLGTAEERALLYHLLKDVWELQGTGPMNLLQGNMLKDNFRWLIKSFLAEYHIDATLATAYAETMREHADLRATFDDLCGRFSYARTNIPDDDRVARAVLIAKLRELLTVSCLKALEPDLIILDEFQRFKDLLKPDNPAGVLAQELFTYADQHTAARVVLLSATPYKMYTQVDEGEDHYRDFLDTVRFLLHDPAQAQGFAQTVARYRQALFRLGDGHLDVMRAAKGELEGQLRRVMVRTERLAVSANRDGMLTERPCPALALQPTDVRAYIDMQQIARLIEKPDVMEYWKSAPYLLSFMEEYELKKAFTAARNTPKNADLARVLADADGVTLPWDAITAYDAIDSGNARLRSLLADTVDTGAWQLLWMPPALPYYQMAGPFAQPGCCALTKRLVFSAWRVVPKAVALLTSYAAERQMIRQLEANPINTPDARKQRRPLLRFALADGRYTGMPVLALIYPSLVLAEVGDPLQHAVDGAAGEAVPSLDVVLERVETILREMLAPIVTPYQHAETEEEAWYWVAPLLLDARYHTTAQHAWLTQPQLAQRWVRSAQEQDAAVVEDDGEQSRWADHVKLALAAQDRQIVPLGRPPQDLVQVLARMAVAGPGPAALRTLAGITGARSVAIRNAAGQIAFAFRSLFNQLDVTALLRGLPGHDPYWRRVLDYCAQGCLSAVLDEYAHLLRESHGLFSDDPDEVSDGLAAAMREALTLRTASMDAEEHPVTEDGQLAPARPHGMRCRFALPFGDTRTEDAEGTRHEKVREAFNSPFWPFVLITTSVGQEGLDFHPYCHAVVHWNLPSNPVDLEQREGRVHRYKGHAVRKNLAQRYGVPLAMNGQRDPWQTLFAQACADRGAGTSDLVPFWVYPLKDGAAIERYVPALPLSRDQARLEHLRRALAVYRMVFGQSRQDDLVAYLQSRLPETDLQALTDELRIDLSPPALPCAPDDGANGGDTPASGDTQAVTPLDSADTSVAPTTATAVQAAVVTRPESLPAVLEAAVQASEYAACFASRGRLFYQQLFERLRRVARASDYITYGTLADELKIDMGNPVERDGLAFLLGELSMYEHRYGRPLLSVLVVHKREPLMPGAGFFDLAQCAGTFDGTDRDRFFFAEINRAHQYWKRH
ncbi:MAG: ATP-dependent helicase HepA [bacterium ADurb.Bin429]|nr:MAG: ATP-dependent helicase HepA [bacterium ADurb.Bin429]